MNVLSLFDGMSCGQLALNRLGEKVENYYASEIDKYAIKVTQNNFPNTIQLGDVTAWESWNIDWSSIDLVTGGFPCQAWSIAGKQLGDKDERGMLFWTTLDIMKKVLEANPNAKFMLENVKMKKEFEEYITFHTEQALGNVNKHLINSSLVSAQNRKRFYWTNIRGIEQPEDKGLLLKDIIQTNGEPFCYSSSGRAGGIVQTRISSNNKAHTLTASGYTNKSNVLVVEDKYYLSERMINGLRNGSPAFNGRFKPHKLEDKSYCLTARYYKQGKTDPYIEEIKGIRRLTPLECERLQTVPDGYTEGVSDTQRYKMLGNGWTVDVIAHIYKNLDKQ